MPLENMTASASKDEDVDPLTSWHKQYLETDAETISVHNPVIQAIQSDELDYDQIEVEVGRLVANADVLRGFCGKCRRMLDHWPGMGVKALEQGIFEGVFTLGTAVHTREIEASARAGCKFCTFLFSRLRTSSKLDTFRKIERRLNLLGSDETTTLSVFVDWDNDDPAKQPLWLNYPQKMAMNCFTSAEVYSIVSERVSPTCEWEDPRIIPHVIIFSPVDSDTDTLR